MDKKPASNQSPTPNGATPAIQQNGSKNSRKFGELLTDRGVLSEEDLEQCLQEQREKRSKRLGDILVEANAIDRNVIENTLQQAENSTLVNKHARVGEILLAANVISPEKLKEALHTQEWTRGEKIGTLLIKRGLISEEQFLSTLAQKLNLRFIDLEIKPPSPSALKAISRNLATKMQIVPVEFRGRILVVATADPTDLFVQDYLSFNAGCAIEMALATSRQILDAQNKYYSVTETEVEKLIDEMASSVEVVEDDLDIAQATESDSAVIKLVNKVLLKSVTDRASDIHFEPGLGKEELAIRFRVDGECRLIYKIPSSYKRAVISRLKIMANLDIAERRKPQSGKIFLNSGNKRMEYRLEITPTAGDQQDAVLRVLANAKPIPLDELGFSKTNFLKFKDLLTKPYGIILCVGPTGSGKTTTLHSALGHINSPKRKIWTAEDPVEITQRGLRQVQINPKIGLTFSEALRSFLRADPDVIMVGEMRDPETARIAVEASLTGHLVLSTLHTNNAAETVNRLLQIGIEPLHFADALLGILAQRLVLKLCDHCKEAYHPGQDEYEKLIQAYGPEMAKVDNLPSHSEMLTLMRKKGCPKCNGSGYFGRIGIHELLLGSERLKQFIANRQTLSKLQYLAINDGMRSLRMDGIQKILRGITDYEQVIKVCI